MSDKARAVVERQVRRVRRRLVWQTLVRSVLTGWSAALVLAALWFVLRPFAFAGLGEEARWAVPAAFLGLGTLAGIVLTWLRAPSSVAAALALDERFTLRERVTTLLTLKPDQAASPVGQALLEDAHQKVGSLTVSERFPLTLPWRSTVPTCAALALAVAAFLFEPFLNQLHFGLPSNTSALQASEVKEIQAQLDNLRKVSTTPKADEPKSESLKELESEWDKLINRSIDLNSQEKVRERVGELRKLEDKLKERLDALKDKAEKTDLLRKELEKLASGDKKLQEGPAKDFEDALAKGQFGKAKEVLEKLQKDLKSGKLNKEEQKKMAEQFKEISEKLQELLKDNDQAKQLQKDFEDGKLSKEEFDRAMEQFQELKDMGNVLGEVAQGLSRGDGENLGESLGRAIRALGDIELSDEELKQCLKCEGDLKEALKLLLKACENGNCNGLNKGERPGGKRPIDPDDPETNPKNERQKGEVDPKGQQRITGFVRGGTFNKVPARSVEGAFQQAVQEAPEAIDRQRIPDDAADIARGYFRKLGNQRD